VQLALAQLAATAEQQAQLQARTLVQAALQPRPPGEGLVPF
jgi:hypothetical protein